MEGLSLSHSLHLNILTWIGYLLQSFYSFWLNALSVTFDFRLTSTTVLSDDVSIGIHTSSRDRNCLYIYELVILLMVSTGIAKNFKETFRQPSEDFLACYFNGIGRVLVEQRKKPFAFRFLLCTNNDPVLCTKSLKYICGSLL
jgi:hypothetical protein